MAAARRRPGVGARYAASDIWGGAARRIASGRKGVEESASCLDWETGGRLSVLLCRASGGGGRYRVTLGFASTGEAFTSSASELRPRPLLPSGTGRMRSLNFCVDGSLCVLPLLLLHPFFGMVDHAESGELKASYASRFAGFLGGTSRTSTSSAEERRKAREARGANCLGDRAGEGDFRHGGGDWRRASVGAGGTFD